MRTLLSLSAASIAALVLGVSSPALAHVDLSDTGIAGARQVIDFDIGHGCAGADTVRVEIRLPTEITSVRAVPWSFGTGDVILDAGTGLPTAVVWSKTAAVSVDSQFYTVSMRVNVPDAPFTDLSFPAIQTCRAADGTETTVLWDGSAADHPAPVLHILPAHFPGWNRYTVPAAITDLSIFDDAEIVWQGSAAYSASPTTMELVESDPTVDALVSIAAGEIWVRY